MTPFPRVLCVIPGLLLAGIVCHDGMAQAPQCIVDAPRIPADISVPNAEATASTFQQFAWDQFLGLAAPAPGAPPAAGGEVPQWQQWSSTIDMLSCLGPEGVSPPSGCRCPGGDCAQAGTRYYPTACRGIPGFEHYRVIGQTARLDDSFLQADTRGLTNSPMIDRNGNFLRYEILASPALHREVADRELWDPAVLADRDEPLVLGCGLPEYTGGDPADPAMGSIVLKAAWMDISDPAAGIDASDYHTESLLIWSPAYRNASGVDSCALRSMALVGLHVVHKTARQPNWTWATFEHRDIAPNCTDEMPPRIPGQGGANTDCPADTGQSWDLHDAACAAGDSACAACNASPAGNDSFDQCRNPISADLPGWCLDQAPAAQAGISRICRQVPVRLPTLDPAGNAPLPDPLPANYPQAAVLNQACVNALASASLAPWTHYFLVSSQWTDAGTLPDEVAPARCSNASADAFAGTVDVDAIRPHVLDRTGVAKPFLGNVTMESYQRSNCLGCHAKSVLENRQGEEVSMDLMYFLSLNVPASDANDLSYHATRARGYCAGETGYPVLDYRLTGQVRNRPAVEQTFDLTVALEVPATTTVLALETMNGAAPSLPMRVGGDVLTFRPDPRCAAGDCAVDHMFPAAPGRRWVQFRSAIPMQVGEHTGGIDALLRFHLPAAGCAAAESTRYRFWASDDSRLRYANFVDGALAEDQPLLTAANPPGWRGPGSYLGAIPTMGGGGLIALSLLLALSVAWRRLHRPSLE